MDRGYIKIWILFWPLLLPTFWRHGYSVSEETSGRWIHNWSIVFCKRRRVNWRRFVYISLLRHDRWYFRWSAWPKLNRQDLISVVRKTERIALCTVKSKCKCMFYRIYGIQSSVHLKRDKGEKANGLCKLPTMAYVNFQQWLM